LRWKRGVDKKEGKGTKRKKGLKKGKNWGKRLEREREKVVGNGEYKGKKARRKSKR
jgi:hypothetical protein